jgi:hypothetical protein
MVFVDHQVFVVDECNREIAKLIGRLVSKKIVHSLPEFPVDLKEHMI